VFEAGVITCGGSYRREKSIVVPNPLFFENRTLQLFRDDFPNKIAELDPWMVRKKSDFACRENKPRRS